MTRGTIKLPEEEYERHNDRRKEMGLSWAEYIDGQSPDQEEMIRRVVREELARLTAGNSFLDPAGMDADELLDLIPEEKMEEVIFEDTPPTNTNNEH